jgi:hypothetical protein
MARATATLLLTAGQLARQMPGPVRHPDLFERLATRCCARPVSCRDR